MSESKYSPEEILQLLNDFYNFQSVFDPEVDFEESLTFETTISEWMNICDLVGPKKLAKSYYDLFQLTTTVTDLENILSQSDNELKDFCNYLSKYAVKQCISPIMKMGQDCMTASIFKVLTINLQSRGVEIQNIRPSSKIVPLFQKHGIVLLEEVNKLVPGSLSKFEYRDNWIVRMGIIIIFFFFPIFDCSSNCLEFSLDITCPFWCRYSHNYNWK
ncbi:MAG: hypothetical protein ABIN95_02620 [Mucilaginibacter sp.]